MPIKMIVLFFVAACLTGCLDITGVNQPSEVYAGQRFEVTVNFSTKFPNVSGTKFGAIKVPVGSTFVSAVGEKAGAITRDGTIEAQLTNAFPPGAGYIWWAGPSAVNLSSATSDVVTITIIAPISVGAYSIDYRAGVYSSAITNFDQSLGNSLTVLTVPAVDSDSDGVYDAVDNCPADANIGQLDTDNDGQGNVCDTDNDNDGMLNTWENAYGLDPLDSSDAAGDADGDSFSNLTEHEDGTNPVNPSSHFRTLKHDFNADRKSDVLFLNSATGGTQYWRGAVKASTTYSGNYDTSYSYKGAGDFDGNGTADIFFTRASNSGTLIWNGAVKSAAIYPGTSTAGFSAVVICDVNGDLKDDVIWHNATTGGTQIWPSAVKASATYPGTQNTAFTVAACVDFDGNGSADILWRNLSTGGNEIWLSANKSTKLYPGANTDLTWSVVGAGDSNGNLNSDLIWYKASTGAIQIWEGGLKSAASYPGKNSLSFTPKTIGDYDGDGSADLLWSSDSTLGTQIWSGFVKAAVTYPGNHESGFVIQK